MGGATSPQYQPTGAGPGIVLWTNHEERRLREHYARGGAAACEAHLPRRTRSAIFQHAMALGLKAPLTVRNGVPRQRWHVTPAIDEAIRRVYQGDARKNAVNELARRLARPRWWVSKRAMRLGLVPPRFKEADWSAAEIAILEESAHHDPATIRRRLARAGFARSEAAVMVKRKRLRLDLSHPSRFNAHQVAGLMGVDSKTVTGWIAKGWLEAGRRGTARTAHQGGDQWWIKRSALRDFIADNAAAVDLREVDKFWFIDLLAGKAVG